MRTFTLPTAAAVLAAAATPAAAFFRMPCQGTAGVARLDPLVNPGDISDHAHVVHGASSESFSLFLVLISFQLCVSLSRLVTDRIFKTLERLPPERPCWSLTALPVPSRRTSPPTGPLSCTLFVTMARQSWLIMLVACLCKCSCSCQRYAQPS